jgi:hypothetical protein
MGTITLTFPSLDGQKLDKLDTWLQSVLWEMVLPPPSSLHESPKFAVHRLKGRIPLVHGEVKMIQGVREVFEITDLRNPSATDEAAWAGKLVLIGKNVAQIDWSGSLSEALGVEVTPSLVNGSS